jgi:hypothetical protein
LASHGESAIMNFFSRREPCQDEYAGFAAKVRSPGAPIRTAGCSRKRAAAGGGRSARAPDAFCRTFNRSEPSSTAP